MNGASKLLFLLTIGSTAWSADAEYGSAVRAAEESLAEGKFGDVIEKLSPWSRDHSSYAEAHHFIGLALYSTQKFSEAVPHLLAAYKLEPPASAARRQTAEVLGITYYLLAKPREAIPLLEASVAVGPVDSKLLYTLAMSQAQAGERAQAVNTFARLYGVPAGSAQALLVSAIHLIQLGRDQDAETLLAQARTIQPALPDVAYRLGMIAMKRSDYVTALRLFEEEVRRSPAHAGSWHSIGEAQYALATPRPAEEALQRAIWLDSRSVGSYLLLARIYMDSDRLDLAEDTLKQTLGIDPRSADAHYLYARLCHKTGRPGAARSHLDAATRLKQESKP